MTIPADIEATLTGLMEQAGPASVLLVAPEGHVPSALSQQAARTIDITPDFDRHHDLSSSERYRLALVVDVHETLGPKATRQLLAWLRNVGAHAVIAAFSRRDQAGATTTQWSVSDFLGLGFRRTEAGRTLPSDYWIYRYDIYDYKITPDWLNSRHWANPGRWDQDRW